MKNILHYKELVYFKEDCLITVLNAAHKNIDYVDEYWQTPHREYEMNLSSIDKLITGSAVARKIKFTLIT